MNTRSGILGGCAAVVLLVTAACGSSSSAAAGSTASSTPAAADSTSAMSSAAAGSTSAMTSAAAGSAVASGPTPTATVGESSDTLDAASTAWFTALCDGLTPLTAETAKMQTAGASGSDSDKVKALSPVLITIGGLYTATASALATLPAPGFTGGADYATKAVAAFKELGTTFTTAGTSAGTGDNSKVATLAKDASAGPAAIDLAGIAIAGQTKAAINLIPSCKTSGVMQ
jgi:hypothetical protein